MEAGDDVKDASTVLFVDNISPGISGWLGAEVQVENKIARRCSYEEMVHEEASTICLENEVPLLNAQDTPEDKFYQVVLRVTQWAITLQDVQQERAQLPNINNKCLCNKASSIGQKLANLTNLLAKSIDAVRDNSDDSEEYLNILVPTLDEVQSALRAGVSIQVKISFK